MITQTDKVLWLTDGDGDWLKLRVSNPRTLCEQLREGQTYDVEIKRHREKRSLDSNAYCWLLIGKLAERYNLQPEEVYREMIRHTSAYEIIPVREDVADRWPSIWGANGIGFIVEDMGPSKIPGYHNFRCFYGSHVYDTAEMSRLIDSLVSECKTAGIETLPPDRLSVMMEGWSANKN